MCLIAGITGYCINQYISYYKLVCLIDYIWLKRSREQIDHCQNSHGSGLASSVVSQQCSDLSLVEFDIEVLYGCSVPIGLSQSMESHAHRKTWDLLFHMRGEATLNWEREEDGGRQGGREQGDRERERWEIKTYYNTVTSLDLLGAASCFRKAVVLQYCTFAVLLIGKDRDVILHDVGEEQSPVDLLRALAAAAEETSPEWGHHREVPGFSNAILSWWAQSIWSIVEKQYIICYRVGVNSISIQSC